MIFVYQTKSDNRLSITGIFVKTESQLKIYDGESLQNMVLNINRAIRPYFWWYMVAFNGYLGRAGNTNKG